MPELTDKLAKAAIPSAAANRIIYDSGHKKAVTGFGLRITPRSAKSFILNYRFHRRERRYTIGSFPDWNAASARAEALRLKQLIDQGRDPLGEKEAARQAPIVDELCDRYLEEHAVKKRTGEEDRRRIDRIVRKAIGTCRVVDISFADIDRLHRKVTKERGPYEANRVHSLVRKMFALAILWRMRADNPCAGVQRNDEPPRERYLDYGELDRLTAALNAYPDKQVANIVKLLLLTGARCGEVFRARWDQIDIKQGLWVKPSSHTKTKRTHRLQLSAPTLQLLAEMKAAAQGKYLFPGKGTDHVVDIKKAWARICRKTGIEGTRLHDLRHTHASLLRDGGADLVTIGSLLGHTQVSTTRRYTHLFDDKLRAATERVGAVLAGNKPAEVHRLRKARG